MLEHQKGKEHTFTFPNLSPTFIMLKAGAEECLVLAVLGSLINCGICLIIVTSYFVLGTSYAFNPHKNFKNTTVIFILQIRKLRHRDENYLLVHIHPLE